MPAKTLAIRTFDAARLIQAADWAAVAVAVSLPWSTSATSILLVVWLLTLIPTLNVAMVQREVTTAAGGLPVLLWFFAALGILWADVSWSQRIHGLNAFDRLLLVPMLLAQFRRSERGAWVLYALLASTAVMLLLSWIMFLTHSHGFSTHSHKAESAPGVVVKDYLSQSTLFLVCAFGVLWRALDSFHAGKWRATVWQAGLAALFLADMAFVVTSRTALIVAPFLVVLLGFQRYGWKGALAACAAGVVLAGAIWESSPYMRARLEQSVHNVQAYDTSDEDNPTGEHIEFIKKSYAFMHSAPLIGHGTGSITELFRRSAAGKTGAAGAAPENPHNQFFAIAIQLGLFGAAVLLAMWAAHGLLFRGADWVAWVGMVVVIDNVVSSVANSALFDFVSGWLYVFGVGVVGGMVLRRRSPDHAVR
jgi:O-antigen ligase